MLLPMTFAVTCFCHGPHIAICHFWSRSAQYHTAPVVYMFVCVSVRESAAHAEIDHRKAGEREVFVTSKGP